MLSFSVFKNKQLSQAWWCMPVIPVLERSKQKDLQFKASLGYTTRLLSFFC
jgi:hypothetical protein